MDLKGDNGEPIEDPAEYLFIKTKYHDRHLTVGDPNSGQMEEIGVVSVYLVSQSTVFREMLEDSMLADPSGHNTRITDVSPEVFKLLLRHVYGGKIPPMSRDTTAELLLCGDKYNIQPLVERTSSLLIPTSVDELFPALICVAYVSLPNLLPHVTKLLQEETDQVVKSKRFLQLDDNSMAFIAKQETLAITELQLWMSLAKWAKAKTEDPSEQRRLLAKPLQHVRLLTFSQDDIVKQVMNSKILSSVEIVDLLSAVTNNQIVTVPGLCYIKEKRRFSGKSNLLVKKSANCVPLAPAEDKFKTTYTWNCHNSEIGYELYNNSVSSDSNQISSNFIISNLSNKLLLESFVIETRSLIDENNAATYYCKCYLTINLYKELGSVMKTISIESASTVVCGMGNFAMNLILNDGSPLVLDPYTNYNFILSFSKPHKVFKTYRGSGQSITDTTKNQRKAPYLNFTSNTPYYHIKEINCKV